MNSRGLDSETMSLVSVGAKMMDAALARAVEQGVQIGVKAAMDYLAEEKQKAKRSRCDRRLHNTRLLLKNYRLFRKHAEGAVFNARQAKESAVDILDGLDDAALSDGAYVEGIKKSQQRTVIILRHIDEMLRYWRVICEQSGKPEDMRRYRVITALYIDQERLRAEDIAEREGIEPRTIYKDVSTAVKPLSALIFGIDGTNME